ncbi:aldo/keto reductase [Luedemannella flava]
MRIAFGTIPLGSAVDQRDSFALLDRFVDAGGTMLDTANNYPFWVEGCTGDESEATIGAWLAARGGAVRDKIFLGTKVGARPVTPGDRTLDHVEGLSAGTIRAGLEASLRRLRTDRVDLYWAHVEDRSVTLDETVGAFDGLVREGKVGAVGASNLPTWRLERARALAASSGRTPVHARAAAAHLPAAPARGHAARGWAHARVRRAARVRARGGRPDAVGVQHVDVRRLHAGRPAHRADLRPPGHDGAPGRAA